MLCVSGLSGDVAQGLRALGIGEVLTAAQHHAASDLDAKPHVKKKTAADVLLHS